MRNNAVGLARDGVNFVELDTTANSSMFQTVATQAGQRYTLSFFYADRIEQRPGQQRPGLEPGRHAVDRGQRQQWRQQPRLEAGAV